ncbi:MAG: hypothetical protein WBC70_04490 [Candidatus Aminicenantales bacterium]
MKKLLAASAMIFVLAMPLLNQEVEETVAAEIGEKVIGYVPVLPRILSPDHNPYVSALCVGLANYYPSHAEYAILDFVSEWSSNQVWDIVFVVVNYSNSSANIKVEMEMMSKDGSARLYKKKTTTIGSGHIMLFTLRVTDKVRNGVGDLFTVNGRVSGAGMGNSNEVKTQVLVY